MSVFNRVMQPAWKPQDKDTELSILKLFGFRDHDFFGGNQGDNFGVLLATIHSIWVLSRYLKECFLLVLLLWDISQGGKDRFEKPLLLCLIFAFKILFFLRLEDMYFWPSCFEHGCWHVLWRKHVLVKDPSLPVKVEAAFSWSCLQHVCIEVVFPLDGLNIQRIKMSILCDLLGVIPPPPPFIFW